MCCNKSTYANFPVLLLRLGIGSMLCIAVIFIKAHDIPIARVALFKISHTLRFLLYVLVILYLLVDFLTASLSRRF